MSSKRSGKPNSKESVFFDPKSAKSKPVSETTMASTSTPTPKKRAKPKPRRDASPPISAMEPPRSIFPAKEELPRLFMVLAIASSVALACNFLSVYLNQEPKPFCDGNIVYDDSISDVCEPCPSNAECSEGKFECSPGFRKLGKFCVEDGEISQTATKLSELIEVHLCHAHAQYLCDGTGAVWAREDDIWNDLDGLELRENFGPNSAVYLYAKQKAMERTGTVLETRTSTHGIKELKCPDLLAQRYKTLTCAVRQWISQHALILMPIFALFMGCTFLLLKLRRRRRLLTRAGDLYCEICDILEENASKSINGESEPWIVASWLRDSLLLPKERKDRVLWKKVQELVQEDSRIDWYPKVVKGEPKEVWEWQVEGPLSSSGKRNKREASKLKSSGANRDINQQLHDPSKAGNHSVGTAPKVLMFRNAAS